MQVAPLGDAEFAALMAPLGPFDGGRTVAGVSGGADSFALALLLRRWGEPFAVVVDHGLRPESGQEAAATVGRLASIGVDSALVRLDLPKGPDLGARAREARYRALLQVCRDRGCPDLLLGHHARDQAETAMLRAARGSGPDGLAGMAAVAWQGHARLLRPLLGIVPARLRATLRSAGLGWVEDPTNQDPLTARGALRQAGRRSGPTCGDMRGTGLARARREANLAEELAAAVSLYPTGHAEVRGDLSERAWSALLWTVSGQAYPPPRAGIRRLASRRAGTLHGVRVAGGIVAREAAAMAAPVAIAPGAVWDGRFACAGQAGAFLGALGEDAVRVGRRSGLPAAVLRTLPAVRIGKNLLIVPHLHYPDAQTSRSVAMSFRPKRPLSGAPFTVGMTMDEIGDAQTA